MTATTPEPSSTASEPEDFEFDFAMTVPSIYSDARRLFDDWEVSLRRIEWADDDAEPARIEVATASLTVIRPLRFVHRSLFDAADELGGDLFALAEVAFGPDDDLAEDLADQLHGWESDVLFLDQVHVPEEHRGHGYGWLVAAEAIATLGRGCRAVVTFPSPAGRGRPEHGTPAHAAECRRLADYWAKLGFVPAGRDNIHLLDLALRNDGLRHHLTDGRYAG